MARTTTPVTLEAVGMSRDEMLAISRASDAWRYDPGSPDRWIQTETGEVVTAATPEGVPDGYVYVSPDEEVGDEYDVVESDAGGTYRSPEPVDDADGDNEANNDNGIYLDGSPNEIRNDVSARLSDADDEYAEAISIISESTGIDEDSVTLPVLQDESDRETLTSELAIAASEGLTDPVEKIGTDLTGSDALAAFRDNDSSLQFKYDLSEDDLDGFAEDGYSVGDDFEWLVAHELGHAHHFDRLTNDETEEVLDASLGITRDGEWVGPERIDLVDEEVSSYGRSSAGELVAEVFAGKAIGKDFSDEVMEIYQEWDGPREWEQYPTSQSMKRADNIPADADRGATIPDDLPPELAASAFETALGSGVILDMPNHIETSDVDSVGTKQTPEGVPDGYVYVSPDEEVGDDFDVVESQRGATYRSPEPVDDGDGSGDSTLASPNEINTADAASNFFSASPIQTENIESLLSDDQLVAAASAFSLIEQSATTNLEQVQAHFSDKPSSDRPGSFSTVDDENLRGDVFFEAESLDEVAQLINSALASFNPASGAITAFPDNIDDLPEDVKDGIVSDGDPVENIFLHEMGHAIQQMKLEEENSPTTARGLLNTMKSGSLPENKLKEEISTRATSNGLEAAAEMFVYQLRGNELPEELQELYERKGGVEVDI